MAFDPIGLLSAAASVASLVVAVLVLRLVVLAGGREDGLAQPLARLEHAMADRLAAIRLELEQRLGGLTTLIARDQGEARLALGAALREMAEENARRLSAVQASVNEQLHASVERQMQTSFQRVLEQFASVQKAMGEVSSMTAQIGDLKRLFSNVKTRGGWGESQLRAILDDVLPAGAYETNVRLRPNSAEVVEFAVRMPVRMPAGVPAGVGGQPAGERLPAPLLAIDAKFPTEAYERLLNAVDAVDAEAERAARRALEAVIRLEARKIALKYILPPVTVEFAILYLPTDGLYAEVARIAGLIDELGRTSRVLVMGPSLIPALLRTIHLGYVTLALEEKTDVIRHLLGATRQEMIRMDQVLDRLARNASTMSNTIEEARRRTRVVARKLRRVEAPAAEGPAEPDDEPEIGPDPVPELPLPRVVRN